MCRWLTIRWLASNRLTATCGCVSGKTCRRRGGARTISSGSQGSARLRCSKDALETEPLVAQLAALKRGERVAIPRYDFKTHSRLAESRPLDPSPVIIVEGILVFVARDAERRVLRYGNAGIPKDQRADEVLRFVEFWERHTGKPPAELGLGSAPRPRLSIFMNVFDVHVNRVPLSGEVIALSYRPGRFFNASFDKASIHNERMALRLRPAAEARVHFAVELVADDQPDDT